MTLTQAIVVTFLFTVPATKASQVWIPPESRDSPADSVAEVCEAPGAALTDLDSAVLYAQPIEGGPRRRVGAESVRGREGQVVSIGPLSLPWAGAHFDLVTKRVPAAGGRESCPSPRVYIGAVTGVDTEPSAAVLFWYDVHGRLIRTLDGFTGIAFARWTRNGKVLAEQKALIVRGEVRTKLRTPF